VIGSMVAACKDTIQGFERTDISAYTHVGQQLLGACLITPVLLLGGGVRSVLLIGNVTGVIVLVLSFTPLQRAFRNRFGNAAMVGVLTTLADAYSHPDHYGSGHLEALVTGVVSGLLALLASYLLEDRGRRIRSAWSMVTRRRR